MLGVQLLLSTRADTQAPNMRDLWFTSAAVDQKEAKLTLPCPGLPIGEDSKLLASWLVWLPLTQRLALRTSRKVEYQTS